MIVNYPCLNPSNEQAKFVGFVERTEKIAILDSSSAPRQEWLYFDVCSAGYSDPCPTCNTSSELNSIALAMAWPCAGPSSSVRRISKSRVPCSSSMRSRWSLVDNLGDDAERPVECQGEQSPLRYTGVAK